MRPEYTPNFLSRYWHNVDRHVHPDRCWRYLGNLNHNGYGRIRADGRGGKLFFAHRVMIELALGIVLPDDVFGLHSCPNGDDHPWCVNPTHLRPGTKADNVRDMDERGRRTTKITPDDVCAIRAAFDLRGGKGQREVAALFGVSQYTIWAIGTGRAWKHVLCSSR